MKNAQFHWRYINDMRGAKLSSSWEMNGGERDHGVTS